MAVLIRSFSQTWSGIGYVREEAEGTLLARSMMAEAIQRNRIAPGSQEGTIGRYAWKMTIGRCCRCRAPQKVSRHRQLQAAASSSSQRNGPQATARPTTATEPDPTTSFITSLSSSGPERPEQPA